MQELKASNADVDTTEEEDHEEAVDNASNSCSAEIVTIGTSDAGCYDDDEDYEGGDEDAGEGEEEDVTEWSESAYDADTLTTSHHGTASSNSASDRDSANVWEKYAGSLIHASDVMTSDASSSSTPTTSPRKQLLLLPSGAAHQQSSSLDVSPCASSRSSATQTPRATTVKKVEVVVEEEKRSSCTQVALNSRIFRLIKDPKLWIMGACYFPPSAFFFFSFFLSCCLHTPLLQHQRFTSAL